MNVFFHGVALLGKAVKFFKQARRLALRPGECNHFLEAGKEVAQIFVTRAIWWLRRPGRWAFLKGCGAWR
jgi:hypothetical protein